MPRRRDSFDFFGKANFAADTKRVRDRENDSLYRRLLETDRDAAYRMAKKKHGFAADRRSEWKDDWDYRYS